MRAVFNEITRRFVNLPLAQYNPLAPGADQLTARVALELTIPLTVLLPFAQDDYLKDFPKEALEPFFELCEQAKEIITFPKRVDPDRAYQALGVYLVDEMDVLIAIWNGQPARGPGGTGEVVESFRQVVNRWPGSGRIMPCLMHRYRSLAISSKGVLLTKTGKTCTIGFCRVW